MDLDFTNCPLSDLDLIILFGTSLQLSVLFQNCRLLHLDFRLLFASLGFRTSVEIVKCFCIWITYYPVMQGVQSRFFMYHVIKVKEYV